MADFVQWFFCVSWLKDQTVFGLDDAPWKKSKGDHLAAHRVTTVLVYPKQLFFVHLAAFDYIEDLIYYFDCSYLNHEIFYFIIFFNFVGFFDEESSIHHLENQ